jgi:hypothetical protein
MSSMNATVAVSIDAVKASGASRSKAVARSHSRIESTPIAGGITRYAGYGLSFNNSQYCR